MKKILVASLALFATASVASAQTVRLGTEGAYMPWNGSTKTTKTLALSVKWAMPSVKSLA